MNEKKDKDILFCKYFATISVASFVWVILQSSFLYKTTLKINIIYIARFR